MAALDRKFFAVGLAWTIFWFVMWLIPDAQAGEPGPEPQVTPQPVNQLYLAPADPWEEPFKPRLFVSLHGGPGTDATIGGTMSYRLGQSFRFGASLDYVANGDTRVSGSVTSECGCKHRCKSTATNELRVEGGKVLGLVTVEADLGDSLVAPYIGAGAGMLDNDWAVSGQAGALARITDRIRAGVAYRVIGAGGENETNHGALFVVRVGAR